MSVYWFFAWFGIEWLRVPLPITLACACVFSYVLGRYGFNLRKLTRSTYSAGNGRSPSANFTGSVVDELKQIAKTIRKDLGDYDERLDSFKAKVSELEASDDAEKSEIAKAARDALESTQAVATRISETCREIRKQSDDLSDLADSQRDTLTGLQNRRALHDALKRMFGMRARYELAFSLIALGYDRGDGQDQPSEKSRCDEEVLKRIAGIIRRTVRDTDLIARYDDQLFVVLLPYATPEAARMLAGRLCERIDRDVAVRVAAGVTSAGDTDDPATLLEKSLTALDQARSHELDNVVFADGDAEARVDERGNELAESEMKSVTSV